MLWYSQEYSMVSLSSGPRIKMCSHISSSTFGLPWPVCLPCCSPLSDSDQLLSLSLLLHRDSYVLQQALRKLISAWQGAYPYLLLFLCLLHSVNVLHFWVVLIPIVEFPCSRKRAFEATTRGGLHSQQIAERCTSDLFQNPRGHFSYMGLVEHRSISPDWPQPC